LGRVGQQASAEEEEADEAEEDEVGEEDLLAELLEEPEEFSELGAPSFGIVAEKEEAPAEDPWDVWGLSHEDAVELSVFGGVDLEADAMEEEPEEEPEVGAEIEDEGEAEAPRLVDDEGDDEGEDMASELAEPEEVRRHRQFWAGASAAALAGDSDEPEPSRQSADDHVVNMISSIRKTAGSTGVLNGYEVPIPIYRLGESLRCASEPEQPCCIALLALTNCPRPQDTASALSVICELGRQCVKHLGRQDPLCRQLLVVILWAAARADSCRSKVGAIARDFVMRLIEDGGREAGTQECTSKRLRWADSNGSRPLHVEWFFEH